MALLMFFCEVVKLSRLIPLPLFPLPPLASCDRVPLRFWPAEGACRLFTPWSAWGFWTRWLGPPLRLEI